MTRPARRGDTYVALVEGGVRRAFVPTPGLVVELTTHDVFISAEEAALRLAELGWVVQTPLETSPPADPKRKRP